MAKKTTREHLTEHLAAMQKKLSSEHTRSKPDPDLIRGYCNDIEQTQRRLDANGPDLDKPHGLDWSAV